MSENCLFKPRMPPIEYIGDRTFFGFFLLINTGYKTSAGCICLFDRGKQAFLWFESLGDSSWSYANGVDNTQHIWCLGQLHSDICNRVLAAKKNDRRIWLAKFVLPTRAFFCAQRWALIFKQLFILRTTSVNYLFNCNFICYFFFGHLTLIHDGRTRR